MLRTAIGEVAAWRDTHPSGSVGSRRVVDRQRQSDRLLTPGLCEVLLAAAGAAGLPPRLVRVEVPEQLFVAQLHAAAQPSTGLREAGLLVAFDDVGAGGTSPRHLREVSADGLKIDRSFIHGMLTDDRDRALVQLLIDFATSIGLEVCAEGVETRSPAAGVGGHGMRLRSRLVVRPTRPDRPGRPVGCPGSRTGRVDQLTTALRSALMASSAGVLPAPWL